MPNIDADVRYYEERDGSRRELSFTALEARVRALGPEFREIVKDAISDSLAEGLRVARQEAPYGKNERNHFRRIRDSIYVEDEPAYAPGASGGGGYYQARLLADATLAPQLKYVWDGTADDGRGHIYPAAGRLRNRQEDRKHPTALRIDKGGEGYHFRPYVRGQKSQREWWFEAQRAIQDTLEERLSTARFIHGLD